MKIPRITIEFFIQIHKNIFGQGSIALFKKSLSEFVIYLVVNLRDRNDLRTLIKWSFCRTEHFLQQMLLASSKNKMHIGQELNVGTQQGLHAFFGIGGNLLKFVNGNIAFLWALLKIFEHIFQRTFLLFFGYSD